MISRPISTLHFGSIWRDIDLAQFFSLTLSVASVTNNRYNKNLLWGISLTSLRTKLDKSLSAVVICAWPTVIPTYPLKTVHIFLLGWTSEENLYLPWLDLTQNVNISLLQTFSPLTHFPIYPEPSEHYSSSGWFQFRNISMRRLYGFFWSSKNGLICPFSYENAKVCAFFSAPEQNLVVVKSGGEFFQLFSLRLTEPFFQAALSQQSCQLCLLTERFVMCTCISFTRTKVYWKWSTFLQTATRRNLEIAFALLKVETLLLAALICWTKSLL